ncbi:MAG: vWA domain-containing protein [Planctomycetota bacterium]
MSWLMNSFGSFWNNALSWWQWAVLAAVPPLIVLLYFLKLRRQPLEVPSTYLWSRTIEDLHVNSIWQRLRKNLLLFLQLLLIALLMLACLRPGFRGTTLLGSRSIFLIDRSASMSATDLEPTRLDEAKRQAISLINQMKSGDVAMVISFADQAVVEQEFTSNRRLLQEKVQAITATPRSTDIREALRAAAGLANVGRSSDASNPTDQQVAQALPATLYLLTDGGFPPALDFDLGNLTPAYVRIGGSGSENLGVVAFTTERNAEKPEQLQAFAQIENSGSAAVETRVSLYRGSSLLDSQAISVPAQGAAGVQFDLREMEPGALRLELEKSDQLGVDNIAYAALNTQRPARVLLVTTGNESLRRALETPYARQMATLTVADPTILAQSEHRDAAATGEFDLIIYDRCQPDSMPACNTLFIGAVPTAAGWTADKVGTGPTVIDQDRAHPLAQMPDMSPVRIADYQAFTAPTGATTLVDADLGPLIAVAPRQSYEDCVVGFSIIGTNDKGERYANTDWPRWYSFPIFLQNSLSYLAGGGRREAAVSVRPGQPVALRSQTPVERLSITSPSGQVADVTREGLTSFQFAQTDETGVYEVREGEASEVTQRFVVNLFDSRESDLRPSDVVPLGSNQVAAASGTQTIRREFWKIIVFGGICLLLFEWYVYNRRVYF